MHSRKAITAFVAAALFAAALIACLLFWHAGVSGEGRFAFIKAADGYEKTIDLSKDASFEVQTSLGCNTVQVENGRIRVSKADCPHQDCVDQGWISALHEQIICLPHELSIEIVEGDGNGNGQIDAVSQ